MSRTRYGAAIDRAVAEAMELDTRVVVLGEDVELLRPSLFARFGPDRVRAAPISESAFLGAGVGAAMAGLRPVVEIMLVDFMGVALDAVLNQMSKIRAFSGDRWRCPLVVRAACGGGYGDAGQHEQALWGLLAGIPGLAVVAPSTPADAAGLMRSAIELDDPVVFLEHKLLSELWLDSLGGASRGTVAFDVPAEGAEGEVATPAAAVPLGSAAVRREGSDLTIVSVAVGAHRALAAAAALEAEGVSAEVIDVRTVRPLDRETILASVRRTGRLLVVDEDYREFGLTGEVAASVLEAGLAPSYARVAVEGTIPYARRLEREALPNVARILEVGRRLLTSVPA